jgi:hypothetical protein
MKDFKTRPFGFYKNLYYFVYLMNEIFHKTSYKYITIKIKVPRSTNDVKKTLQEEECELNQ